MSQSDTSPIIAILLKQNLGKIRDFPEISLIVLNNDIVVKIKEAVLLTLDLKTLEIIKSKSFEDGHSIDAYIYDNDRLYLKKNGIVCYNVEKDSMVWETQFETWGTAVPLVTKKYIFINSGSKIVVINKENGKILEIYNLDKYRSRFQVDSNGFDRNYIPTSFIAVDNTLLVACGDGGLYAFEGAKEN